MRFVREDMVTSKEPSPDKCSAGVWQAEILSAIRDGGLRAHRFSYRPGAHSHWHIHDGEQALYVLAGRGIVTRWEEPKGTEVGPGDWVHVEPGEKHWHGAVLDDVFVHLAITATGGTEWLEIVEDDEYESRLP